MATDSLTWTKSDYFILLELSGLQLPRLSKVNEVSTENTEENIFLHFPQILGITWVFGLYLFLPSSSFTPNLFLQLWSPLRPTWLYQGHVTIQGESLSLTIFSHFSRIYFAMLSDIYGSQEYECGLREPVFSWPHIHSYKLLSELLGSRIHLINHMITDLSQTGMICWVYT